MTAQQDAPDFTELAKVAQTALRDLGDAFAQIRDAVREAWNGPVGQMMRRRAAVLAARRAHREDGYRDYRVDDRPPSGCAVCGRPERYHGRIWHRSAQRYETHVRPDASTILVRMQVRRAERLDRKAYRFQGAPAPVAYVDGAPPASRDDLPAWMTVTDTAWRCQRCQVTRTTAPEHPYRFALGHVNGVHRLGRRAAW